jgi:hypothetical protein
MSTVIRTTFEKEVWRLIFDKQAALQKEKLRVVTPGQAIEVLLKDAYLRKSKASK